MDLFISVHGERFVQARFPFSESKNFTHLDYHIIDVTDEGQIMVIVNHGPVISHLYTSTRMTPYEAEFSLSLERVMFYNPNVTWHDSWLAATAGDEPFADVYKIQGNFVNFTILKWILWFLVNFAILMDFCDFSEFSDISEFCNFSEFCDFNEFL